MATHTHTHTECGLAKLHKHRDRHTSYAILARFINTAVIIVQTVHLIQFNLNVDQYFLVDQIDHSINY